MQHRWHHPTQEARVISSVCPEGERDEIHSGQSILPDFRSIETQSCSYPTVVAGYSEAQTPAGIAKLVLHLYNLVFTNPCRRD